MKAKQKTTTKEAKKAKVVKTVKEQIEAINKTENPLEKALRLTDELAQELQKLGFNAGLVLVDNGNAIVGGHFGSPLTCIGICEKTKQRLINLGE